MAYTTFAELQERYGTTTIDMLSASAHERSGGASPEDVVTLAIETADTTIDRELMNLYEAQLPFDPVPTDVKKVAEELAVLVLRERGEGLAGGQSERWKQLVDLLQRWGKGELKIKGVSRTSSGLARSSVNDGRVSITKRSHYDENGNRIEGENERTPLDIW